MRELVLSTTHVELVMAAEVLRIRRRNKSAAFEIPCRLPLK